MSIMTAVDESVVNILREHSGWMARKDIQDQYGRVITAPEWERIEKLGLVEVKKEKTGIVNWKWVYRYNG